MIKILSAFIVGAVVYTCAAVILSAQASFPPENTVGRTDVDGNGIVNSIDLLIVAKDFGQRTTPNACVEYEVFDGVDDPTYPIVNSLGEYVTPQRGGHFLITWEHPAYDAYRQGTQVPLVACP